MPFRATPPFTQRSLEKGSRDNVPCGCRAEPAKELRKSKPTVCALPRKRSMRGGVSGLFERNAYLRRNTLSGLRFCLSPCLSFVKKGRRRPLTMPPLMVRGGVAPTNHASPYGKGRCRAERDGGDKSKSAKSASLVMHFLPLRNAEHEQERKGTLPHRGKEGGKTAI